MKNLALVAALTAMFVRRGQQAGPRCREQDRERIEAAEIKRQRKAAKRLRERQPSTRELETVLPE
jgi:hypothetical protein